MLKLLYIQVVPPPIPPPPPPGLEIDKTIFVLMLIGVLYAVLFFKKTEKQSMY